MKATGKDAILQVAAPCSDPNPNAFAEAVNHMAITHWLHQQKRWNFLVVSSAAAHIISSRADSEGVGEAQEGGGEAAATVIS